VESFLNDHITMLCEGVMKQGDLLSQQDQRLKENTETLNNHQEKVSRYCATVSQ